MKRYGIVYADPPWAYKSRRSAYIKNNSGETKKHYDTMSIKAVQNYFSPDRADKNAVLLMWFTFPMIGHVETIMNSWGFTYKTVFLTWIKSTKDGSKPAFGVGYYTRSNAEVLLLGTRGRPPVYKHNISSILITPRQAHSKKPDEVYSIITDVFGTPNRIELFARQRVDGWDSEGDQL